MRSFLIFFIILSFIAPSFLCYGYSSKEALYSNYIKGVYSMQQDDSASAIKYLQAAKREAPDSIHIRLKIATALIQAKKIDQAEKVLEEAKEIDPDNLDTYLALIFIYSYQKKEEKLAKEYEIFLKKAHQKKPKNMTISSYLAQFYLYQRKPMEAIALYEKILENKPENLEALFWLGYLYDQVGENKKAKEIWEQGLEINSAYAPILNALGYSYAEEGIKLNKAEKMIKKALKIEPRNGAYLDSLGWVYFKKNKLQKAKEYIEKAISYAKDPEIYHHLGTVYIKLGKVEQGLEIYKQGLERFPDYHELKEEIEKYEKKSKKNKE
ncbi:MAG: tetratricopeptide repeat protein [Candidatus Omnitrophica bacterium]|nr:tetratricopeptide repeat protein [Candidatus Omnitrophota bacterium]